MDLPREHVGNLERGDAVIGQEPPEGLRDLIAANSPGPGSHACLTLFATLEPPLAPVHPSLKGTLTSVDLHAADPWMCTNRLPF